MGGDGGVIASQRKFVRGTKNSDEEKDSKNIKQQQITRTRICGQSSEVSNLFFIIKLSIIFIIEITRTNSLL